ncbi:unnamed protein product [Ophioblennius macclurei]
MKAARGSQRAASEQKNKKTTAKKPKITKDQDRLSSGRSHEDEEDDHVIRKVPQKKKVTAVVGGSSSASNGAKSKANWEPMSRASMAVVENVLDLSLLATLSSRSSAKQEHHEHLNTIKKRFLEECKQLKVPVQRQNLQFSHQRHQEESRKSVVGKKSQSALEKDLSAVVSALEKMEEQMVSLQHDCSVLRNQVEEEEEKAKSILELTEQNVLNLPLYSPSRDDETTAEMRLGQIISNAAERESLAKKLGDILRKSKVTEEDQALLRQARTYADQLFGNAS